jgi:4-amino-4-deoxy-L-arabinose transferase-like glycosyltransferase
MGKSVRKRIITKNPPVRFIDRWFICIISVATFLRVFRLDALTEFLGDQGRTMLVLYDWVHRGVFPMSGPSTLSGHYLGPFFYYILVPGYVFSGGSAIGVSLWMALLGVLATYILYKAVHIIYGRFPAIVVSALYAVSPAIVMQDRIIWEPNLVPLFAIMFAWLSIQQHHRVSFRRVLAQGAVCGVLVQLHYPNIFFIALLGVVSFGHSIRVKYWKYVPQATLGWLIGFILVLTPFLIYESGHGFADIRGIADVFLSGGSGMGKRETLMHAWDYAGRVIGKMLPGITAPVVIALGIGWTAFLIANFNSWNIFWSVWFALGVLAMARYNGVVYDHYLNFLIPVPFFMTASVVSRLRGIAQTIGVIVVVLILITQVAKTDILAPGNNDIRRVSAAVTEMIKQSGDRQFSFTLINGRSFSDMHYRYYFRTMGSVPEPVSSNRYTNLYIVCDSTTCPSTGELTGRNDLSVLCYDAHCSGSYPTIPLMTHWRFVKEEPIQNNTIKLGAIYLFNRR